MIRPSLFVSVAVAFVTASVLAQRASEHDSIQAADLKADLFFLASDGMRGRLTDTAENGLAAEFIKARFERLGLTPAGPNHSFFHTFQLTTARLGDNNSLSVQGGKAPQQQFRPEHDFYPLRFSPSARARGPVVFAGYGISAPQLGYDDYAGQDVSGRIVLVLDHEPGETDPASPFDGVVTSEYANPLRKAVMAQEHGAVGLLVVADVHNHESQADFGSLARDYWPVTAPRIERYMLTDWVDQVRIPVAQISPAAAEMLTRGTERLLADLARAAETNRGTLVPVPATDAALSVNTERRTTLERNVVATVEGTDPTLAREWIIICAHFDHQGAEGDLVYNGADDDGSGTVALLEIAEAYALAARDQRQPRRSVLLAAWNAEERGLLGAWAYTERPLVPLEQTVAVFNMDMIGRDEEVPQNSGSRFRGFEPQTAESNANAVNVLGYTRSHNLVPIVEEANAGIGLEIRRRYDNNVSNLLRRSDHWPFLQRGVPAIWVHTGLHPDYHTPTDDPERINYVKLERITRLVYLASRALADRPERPRMVGR